MNFLHTFQPQSVFLDIGFINIRWYGIFMVLALLAGLFTSLKIAKWHGVKKEVVYDLFFYLVIFGFLGARIFYILYNFNYFWNNPVDIFKIWQGGIAIHGALVFGILVLFWLSKKLSLRGMSEASDAAISPQQQFRKNNEIASPTARNDSMCWFWLLAAIIAPGLALGQAIGRFGNYFNQELFGLPTDLPWGIPIALANRPAGFESFSYFHPTFLYELIGNLIIFGVLLWRHWRITHNVERITHNTNNRYALRVTRYANITISYLLLYSILRFFLEFLRIDPTAGSIFGIRATQGLSLLIFLICAVYLIYLWQRDNIQKLSPPSH